MPGARVSQGERVSLRTVEEEDTAFCQRASANPEIRVPMGNPVRSRSDLGEFAEKEDGDQFLACLDEADAGPGSPEEGQFTRIGWVGIDDVSYRRPDLGYWLVPEHHGEGYGKEMLALAIEYTFHTYDYPAVGAIVYEFNEASRGVLESLGFEEEGRIRRDRFIGRRVRGYGAVRAASGEVVGVGGFGELRVLRANEVPASQASGCTAELALPE